MGQPLARRISSISSKYEAGRRTSCCRTYKKRERTTNGHRQMSHKPLLAILAICVAITLLLAVVHRAQAGLIRIYHKYKDEEATIPADLANDTLVSEHPLDGHIEAGRRATIEINSPMKRIMELIGHHAPLIVVDSSGTQEPVASPQVQNTLGAASSSSQGELGGPNILLGNSATDTSVFMDTGSQQQLQPQLQAQQQQQHWTIMDTSQFMPAQQPQNQQNQPTAQQQQLVQSSVPNNEQYFTFTPFGLTPTSNPFGQTLNSYMVQPNHNQAQQMTQSSQNYQQQQQAALEGNQVVQPVFLSSYVPELPATGNTAGSFHNQALSPFVAPGQQTAVQQQQSSPAPNSIQQIQQAQKEAPGKRAKSAVEANNSEVPAEDPDDRALKRPRAGGAKDDDEDNENNNESPSTSSGPSEEADDEPSGQAGEPSSGSLSYEDKYDSDRDEAQQRPSMNHAGQQQPAASGSSGLVSVGLNDDCLQCICRASSGCDHLLRCITIGAEDKFCGPFQLTEEYWQRAGSPGDANNNFSSFEECANDADCAVETVTNYMKKYFKDCDGDENVTCVDYARLHRLPPDECHNTAKLAHHHEAYWEKFQRCAEGYNRTRNGDDEDI